MAFNAYGSSPNRNSLPPLLGSFTTLEEAIDELVVLRSGGDVVHVLGQNECGYDTISLGKWQEERGRPGRWLKADVHLGVVNTHRAHCVSVGMVFEEN